MEADEEIQGLSRKVGVFADLYHPGPLCGLQLCFPRPLDRCQKSPQLGHWCLTQPSFSISRYRATVTALSVLNWKPGFSKVTVWSAQSEEVKGSGTSDHKPVFLHPDLVVTVGCVPLHGGRCSVYCRTHSIAGLHLQDISSSPTPGQSSHKSLQMLSKIPLGSDIVPG